MSNTPTDTDEIGLTDDDHAKLQQLADAIADGTRADRAADELREKQAEADEWRGPFRVSTGLCDRITDEYERTRQPTVIADELGLSTRVVLYHATGECDHSTDGVIDPARCAVIREQARDGMSFVEIGEWHGTGDTNARAHARGGCTCGRFHDVPAYTEPRDAEHHGVDADTCSEWRRRVKAGETPPRVAQGVPHHAGTVRSHVYGRCSCPASEPPAATPSDGQKTTVDDCRAWRQEAHATGISANRLSNDVPFTTKTVSYHLYGSCACEHGVEPAEKSPS